MHYFYLQDEVLSNGKKVALNGEDIKHAFRVLRLKPDEEIAVSDGRGRAYRAIVTMSGPDKVEVSLTEALFPGESPLKITLYQGLPKADKLDLVVRQAVELGIYRIQPVKTSRSIPLRSTAQEEKWLQRWRAIARSAAAQCRRAFLPIIEQTVNLKDLPDWPADEAVIVPWEQENIVSLNSLLSQPCPDSRAVNVIIGPEGGFEPGEIEFLAAKGATTVSLGPRILRTETAALAVVTMVQAAWGDL